MQQRLQPEFDLTIDPETVRQFVLKARAISAALNDDYDAGHEHEIEIDDQSRDRHAHDGLAEEEEQNLTASELRALIEDLNVDEAADLLAIMFIGRGDFDAREWDQAVAEARPRVNKRVSTYLLGMPMLGEWLEEGLEKIGA
ncbi:DUF3775 domain-containing protein [Mesorhizobium sp. YIM 152430]|uniref:DUF3775 domain-containing protein n=1 Tax=Mesorhizobium sp. YIM 152430 TaxID=3031761 RepID=UPI0023DBDA5F|nr:DUF3775 domain-containing protein [Mesorhizobium sp. YIM 152430]MDF1598514.1 DUF3775 domain-containing protein [Mesorhizobium sp. YIM 152430]